MFDFQQGGTILQKYLSILRNSPFFKGLTDNEILSILHCVNATTISKKRDSYIFRAGDITEVMGIVVSGCVLIIQEDIWGHRNILSKCHAGDFFGEPYAASQRAVLNISVVADEDCEIILLNVKRLLITCPTACEHHQKLIRNLVSVLANKILILNDKITHVGKRTTRDKLLSYLSAESIRHSSLSFDIPFDRQQLADYLCIDRAAMSTEISKLQKEGFIKTNRNHFELNAIKDFKEYDDITLDDLSETYSSKLFEITAKNAEGNYENFTEEILAQSLEEFVTIQTSKKDKEIDALKLQVQNKNNENLEKKEELIKAYTKIFLKNRSIVCKCLCWLSRYWWLLSAVLIVGITQILNYLPTGKKDSPIYIS